MRPYKIDLDVSRHADIIIRRGAALNKTISVVDSENVPFDFNGYSAELLVFTGFDDRTPNVSFTMGQGILLTSGAIILSKTVDQLRGLRCRNYVYFLYVTDNEGHRRLWLNGYFRVNEGFHDHDADNVVVGDSIVILPSGNTILLQINIEQTNPEGDNPPVMVNPPTISGVNKVGNILTCAPGDYTGAGQTRTYQWYRDSSLIINAIGFTYFLTPNDMGHNITCRETVSNAFGTLTVVTNVISVTMDLPPVLTVVGMQLTDTVYPMPEASAGPGPLGTYAWPQGFLLTVSRAILALNGTPNSSYNAFIFSAKEADGSNLDWSMWSGGGVGYVPPAWVDGDPATDTLDLPPENQVFIYAWYEFAGIPYLRAFIGIEGIPQIPNGDYIIRYGCESANGARSYFNLTVRITD